MYDVFLNFCFPLFYTLEYHYHPNTKTKIKTKDLNDQQHKKMHSWCSLFTTRKGKQCPSTSDVRQFYR